MRRTRETMPNAKTIAMPLLLILVVSLSICAKPAPINAELGRSIDLFTVKTLYQPQELVTLYALVTYNEAPVALKDVAFQIEGPQNVFRNASLWRTSRTNSTGIAETSFRIIWPDENPEAITFGTWFVVATVDLFGEVINDTLTFQVYWIIEITNIETLNVELSPRTLFLRQATIVFNLTIENRAATEKTTTISIDVQDAVDHPIIHVEMENLVFQPGESTVQGSARIPTEATIGQATAWAAAHTAPPKSGGILYSPGISTIFQILTRDIAITSVTPSKTRVESSEIVDIIVGAKNKGNETESFYVTAYYDYIFIAKKHVDALPPSMETQIIFEWDTTGIPPGDYVISAIADPVEGEIEVSDNVFVDGIVTILFLTPPTIRDVAVTLVEIQPTQVCAGETVQIRVRVKNLGTFPENFNVIIYYNSSPITELYVSFLAPGADKELIFLWDTHGVAEGHYTTKAYIPPLPDETSTANNLYIDGIVTIRAFVSVKVHDVAIINVHTSSLTAYIGDVIEITVVVANLGEFTETFNVTAYYNSSLVAEEALSLGPDQNARLNFNWHTSAVTEGAYIIWAFADSVPGETDSTNNLFVDGTVILLTPPVPPDHNIHDVAVIAVQPERQSVFVGETVAVIVRVKNYGNVTESFNVTLYYDFAQIQNRTIYSLTPGAEQTLLIEWNTKNVEPGTYVLNANVTILPNEVNTENNFFEDGQVSIRPGYEVPLWLLLIPFLIGLALIALLLLLLLLRRRRKKQPVTGPRYVILSHPHI